MRHSESKRRVVEYISSPAVEELRPIGQMVQITFDDI